MSARDELAEAYEQWRKLTEAEAEAIRRAAWEQLEQAQSAKARLQPLIAQAAEKLQREVPAHFTEREAIERHFQSVVEELIQLERRNSALLAVQHQTADAQKANLERTSRNLRQIHRSYAGGGAGAHWESYS